MPVKLPLRLQLAEQAMNVWCLYMPPETTVEDMQAVSFWANVAKVLRPGDEIKVVSEDLSWRAVFFVRAVGRVEVITSMLSHETFGDGAAALAVEDTPYETKWRGPARQFGVVKRNGGDVIKDGFQTRDAADRWIADHMKALAA